MWGLRYTPIKTAPIYKGTTMPKAWRDPCKHCAKAAFMLCIKCETMSINRTTGIKLVKRAKKVKVKVPMLLALVGR